MWVKNTTLVGRRLDLSDRVVAFLRHRHGAKWAECASAATRWSISAFRKLEERGSAPSMPMLDDLGAAYGAEFVASAFPAWRFMAPAVNAMRQDRLESDIAAKRREIEQLLAR